MECQLECTVRMPQELGKFIYVGPLHHKTHIWSSETMIDYLAFLAEELRHRRKALNLKWSDKCLILCDQASQHSSKKFATLKEQWMAQHNAEP